MRRLRGHRAGAACQDDPTSPRAVAAVPPADEAHRGIQLGALVCLVDADERQPWVFLGPAGGSMKLEGGDEVSVEVGPHRLTCDVLKVAS